MLGDSGVISSSKHCPDLAQSVAAQISDQRHRDTKFLCPIWSESVSALVNSFAQGVPEIAENFATRRLLTTSPSKINCIRNQKLNPLTNMKKLSFPVPVLLLAIDTLLIASCANPSNNNSSSRSGAVFATSNADGGHLVIKPSPVLGDNVFVTIRIGHRRQSETARSRVVAGAKILDAPRTEAC